MIFLFMLLAQLPLAAFQTQECGVCHRREATGQTSSPMAAALHAPGESKILKANPKLDFKAGKYAYTIRREGDASIYSVSDGTGTISAPIKWVFGSGVMGQTYMLRRNGVYYESAASFFPAVGALDWTLGHEALPRRNLEEAFGRKVDSAEARRCFSCHSTGAVWNSAGQVESVSNGVQCTQCHSGALQHMNAAKGGDFASARMTKLSEWSTEELAGLCSKCHQSWEDVTVKGPRGVLNVRAQLYRLTNSRCYDSADRRISCTACHNVHGDLNRDTSSYNSKCQACHPAGGQSGVRGAKACPVAQDQCVTCHMPKVEVPGLHYTFSDHRIRIVRPGDKYPD